KSKAISNYALRSAEKPVKILVVDDNTDDALLLSSWLKGQGHTASHAGNGEEALAHLRQDSPDLILSDILMPRLDGFALCRAVKRDPLWRTIPFVFCTATYTDEADAALALRLGAQRFLTKPLDFDRLQALLNEVNEAGPPALEPDDGLQVAPATVRSGQAEIAALDEPAYLQMYNERLVHKLEENYRQLQTIVADLRRQNEKLWSLTETSRALSEAISEANVEQTLVQRALELTGAETALLILLEEEDLVISRVAGRYGGVLQGLVLPAADSLCGRAAHRNEALLLNGTACLELAAELLLADAPAGAMLASLRLRETSLGLLVAWHSMPDRFDTGLLQFFRLLAHEAAITLENARLIDTLRTQADALRRTQDQLVHNARMATVGRLTAALAHEINNPLQSILGSVKFSLEQLPPDAPQRSYLELAAGELDRVSDILRRMVGFYRRDANERLPTDLNALLRETLTLAEKPLQRHRVAVITDLDPDLPHPRLAPNQFKQIFLNLILNAADAIDQGGQLQISTGRDEQGRLEIRFTDSGPGLPAPEIERIFEAFYTTKPHGTGLGLAISRDIALAHGGDLLVESEPGQGATFRVVLPVA
ncbi:MAG TPA: ATP-binding protein, partial [Anaerolineae bacterium]